MEKFFTAFIIVLILTIPCCNEQPEPVESIQPDGEEEITIASWNLKNFGQTKLNDPERIAVI